LARLGRLLRTNRADLHLRTKPTGISGLFNCMPAYSFHLCTPGASRPIRNDHSEFPDVGAALAEAARIGRGMIRQRVRRKPCELCSHLDVRDDGDAPVARILLAELARQIS
jgi:hypothetical protein